MIRPIAIGFFIPTIEREFMTKPLVRRIETTTGHYYVNDKDQPIPGVTTILKSLPKEALNKWNLRKAVELAMAGEAKWDWDGNGTLVDYLIAAGEREAFKAADIGTNAHNFAEAHMLGLEPDFEALGKKEKKHAACYLNFVRDYQPKPVLVEKVLAYIDPKSNRPLYCGTMDLIADLFWNDTQNSSRLPNDWVDGETWMCDYKASAGQPRPSHALQTAAYRYSTHWIDEDGVLQEMVPVDHGAVILLNGGKGESCYRMYKLDTSKIVFQVFKALLTISNFSKIEDRVIIGEM
jgi:hypothetical protein